MNKKNRNRSRNRKKLSAEYFILKLTERQLEHLYKLMTISFAETNEAISETLANDYSESEEALHDAIVSLCEEANIKTNEEYVMNVHFSYDVDVVAEEDDDEDEQLDDEDD